MRMCYAHRNEKLKTMAMKISEVKIVILVISTVILVIVRIVVVTAENALHERVAESRLFCSSSTKQPEGLERVHRLQLCKGPARFLILRSI